MAPLAPLLLIAAQASTSTSVAPIAGLLLERAENTVEVRFASGAEWDTNARRAVKEGRASMIAALDDLDIVQDGLVRVTGSVTGRLSPSASTVAFLSYQLGAKRFFREQSQDFMTHQFIGQGAWFVTPWLTVGVSGSFRLSRIRNGVRDYNIGNGSVYGRWLPTDRLSFGLTGTYRGYRFLFDDHFDYRGPSVGADVLYRIWDQLRAYAAVGHHWDSYARTGLVQGQRVGTLEPVPTFCDSPQDALQNLAIICSPEPRDDTEIDILVGARYTGSFQLGGQYRLRAQRSTSPYENIDRHSFDVDFTFSVMEDLTATVLGVLQFSNGVSVTDNLQLAEDDENRNSLSVGLRYALTDRISADVRYAFYVDQFSTNDASYSRHLFYAGLGYRTGVLDLDAP